MNRKTYLVALFAMLALLAGAGGATAQTPMGTAFTYQGRLTSGGIPVNDNCDFQFRLFDAAPFGAGAPIGGLQAPTNVAVTNGQFTVRLDFGATAFNGDARWLEVAVRCPAGPGSYTLLSPRQELTATPYALYASSAGSAKNLTAVGASPLLLTTNGVERLRITSEGNVGLGTASPQERLALASSVNLVTEMATPRNVNVAKMSGGFLSDGTYWFKIVACDRDCTSENAPTTAASNPPVICTVDGTSTNRCRLSWDPVPGAAMYRIYKAGQGPDRQDRYKTTTNTSFDYDNDSATIVGEGNVPGVTTAYVNKLAASGPSWLLGGNVGIGTTTPHPNYRLTLEQSGSHSGLVLRNTGAVASEWAIQSDGGLDGTAALGVYSWTAGAYRLWINGQGNVGIGTTNPQAKLQIASGSILLDQGQSLAAKIDDGRSGNLIARGGDNNIYLGDPVLGNHLIVNPGGNVGIGMTNPGARLDVAGAPGIHTIANFASPDVLANRWVRIGTGSAFMHLGVASLTGPQNTQNFTYVWSGSDNFMIGADGNPTLVVRGMSNGNVGIGTTSPGAKLHVAGNIFASDNICIATGGPFGSPICLSQLSDAQLKSEIESLGNMLDLVDELRGVSFRWNHEAESLGYSSELPQIGVIAQEVEAVFPELVYSMQNGYKAVDYAKLSAVLIEALKELRAEKDTEMAALRAENVALAQRVDDMESRLIALEEAAGLKGDGGRFMPDGGFVPPTWLFFGGLIVAALAVGRRWIPAAGGGK